MALPAPYRPDGDCGSRAAGQLKHPALLLVGAALLLVGLGFKVSAVPFHMWTPDVYQGAPSPVTAWMAVSVKVAGLAALLRVFLIAFPALAAEIAARFCGDWLR